MQRFYSVACLFFAGFMGSTPALFAQVNTSAISGVVTDESGSVVLNASVTVTQATTGLVRKVETSTSGEYVVPQLSPGVTTSTFRPRASSPPVQRTLIWPLPSASEWISR